MRLADLLLSMTGLLLAQAAALTGVTGLAMGGQRRLQRMQCVTGSPKNRFAHQT